MFRKIIFWTHLCVGITAGLVILNSAVTGTLLAFEPQIVDFAERGVRRVVPPPSGERWGIDALVAKARETEPDRIPNGVTVKSDPAASVAVNFGKETGVRYLNPYTGEVLGKDSWIHGALHEVQDWHRWLWSREIGKVITGAADILFFLLAVSGIYLWWPNKVFHFEGKLQGKARDWNWHNVIGFWCAPLILITTITGAAMSYQWANDFLYRAAGSEPPVVQKMPEKPKTAGTLPFLDPFLEKAGQQVPGWVSINLRLPQKEGAPVTASIQEPAPWWVMSPRSQLSLDPKTAETVKWEPYSEQSAGRKWRTYAKYLHTGQAGGVAGQFLMCLSAIGITVMVWTGFALAWRRFFKQKQTAN